VDAIGPATDDVSTTAHLKLKEELPPPNCQGEIIPVRISNNSKNKKRTRRSEWRLVAYLTLGVKFKPEAAAQRGEKKATGLKPEDLTWGRWRLYAL
jgi:hypothetical protein